MTRAPRDEFDVVVVRTDYGDDRAWHALVAALRGPSGEHGFEAHVHLVDEPAWEGATTDAVRAAFRAEEDLSVVFVADRVSMRTEEHPLLALTLVTREDCADDEEYEELTEFGTSFRASPAAADEIHANLSIANLGFEDFAAAAHYDPEGICRASAR
ncbi:DUF6924 domain-containing protein [uncultured Streptomyces sp.]|uniref:DUF6924 domain-containing protein n=1 Tax=uncultured Streptomyces sp. TaxID=174707 RepID=UPI002626FE44|nr:hypothetical protein [uncultured Streptomyces sp.]